MKNSAGPVAFSIAFNGPGEIPMHPAFSQNGSGKSPSSKEKKTSTYFESRCEKNKTHLETIDPSEIVNLQVAQKISGRFLAKSLGNLAF